MFFNSKDDENSHRKQKRELEVSIAIKAICSLQGKFSKTDNTIDATVLEFGCGDGFQIPALRQLGSVVASDVYRGKLDDVSDVEFVQCSITDTPFPTERFDIIYSNHVVEHIDEIELAFEELIRIGKPDCIYAFSVPTNVWLLLSLPAQYLGKVKNLASALHRLIRGAGEGYVNVGADASVAVKAGRPPLTKFLSLLAPKGHGVIDDYIGCYRQFKVSNWSKLFAGHGFSILEVQPLLLYAPSECPVIPTVKSRFGLCSSVLFLMRKSASAHS